MSIEIKNLVKVYGTQTAVNNISLTIRQGEIVGFLGPNGAGKSTTMKIATCYLPPTSGQVSVGGFDVQSSAMKVKQITGYLPEHNPLYLDLYVHEYLSFIASLYGLKGKKLKDRVGEMVELCGLQREQNKRIDALSKGYRQRVGLAQALIHDPKVLILDEPTSGLDPNQLVEIRRLIKSISVNKTVIFSTHIMQEVEALCDRVVVINRGEIVADDLLVNLMKGSSGTIAILVEFEKPVEENELHAIHGVVRVELVKPFVYRIVAQQGVDIRPDVFRLAANKNLSLLGLKQEETSLEGIFHTLTHTPVNQQ